MSNQEINAQLLAALKDLFADYKSLADSGDAGFWSLEDLPVGKQAIAAIAAAEATDRQKDCKHEFDFVGESHLHDEAEFQCRHCGYTETVKAEPQPPASEPDVYALDAARYQWLLHQAWFQEACDRFDFEDGGLQNRFEKCVDEMIDRTMLAAAKEQL